MTTYLLFGESASGLFEEGEYNQMMREKGYELFTVVQGETDPLDLLESYDGYLGYMILSEDEYNFIRELEDKYEKGELIEDKVNGYID